VESVRDIALKIATGQAFVDEDAIRLAEAWLSERDSGQAGVGASSDAPTERNVPASRSESDEEAA
jgi:hypothetical protein